MASEPAPRRWVSHYPRMLLAYRRRGEDGLEELEEELRAAAARQPEGKFSKRQAAYVPVVPLPPLDWRHECGHCRFWVDEGPGKPGECMIVGREDDSFGGKAIHEKAGCALFMPPAGERPFAWIREQLAPTGADIVRGEFHPAEGATTDRVTTTARETAADRKTAADRIPIPVGEPSSRGDTDGPRRRTAGRPRRRTAGRPRRHTTERRVGGPHAPVGARVDVETVVEGLAAPNAIEFHPEGAIQYVADQNGVVHVHDEDGLDEEPMLDLRERLVDLRPQYDERGLLGLALHPEFPDDPRVFVRYSTPTRSGTPPDYDHTEVLSSFEVSAGGRTADPASEEAILGLPSPQFNHNAGAIAFGPDGYLYVAMGDGGNEGDRGPGHVEGGNAQDVTENLLGSILRVDVDTEDGEEPYVIPEDNPLVDEEGLDELYAWGLRNPWRLSFDGQGRLFVADVGQHLFEEVNLVERGGNYGWPIREGFHCFDPENPTEPPSNCPAESRRGEPLLDPILEYPHVSGDTVVGSAVIGGYIYEGDDVADLEGAYVFGDWATTQDRPSGRLFAARPPDDADGEWSMEELAVASTDSGRPERHVLGFGRDPDGELYVLANETHAPVGNTGSVLKVVPPVR